MDLWNNVIVKLDVHTKQIKTEDLQDVMQIVKKTATIMNEQLDESCTKILAKLWHHLTSELDQFDDQLLCCTCFYSALSNSKTQEWYLNKALQIINQEIFLKQLKSDEKSNTSIAVSLCYGMFQSSYLTHHRDKPLKEVESLLNATFELMTLMAYDYSQYTFIVFKIMTAFKKAINTPFQEILFTTERKIKLLNVVNHNWENPITGVRNLNRIIFQMVLLVLDKDMYEKVLIEINGFYWNKAKYLMLTEIIEHDNSNIEDLVVRNHWIHGLVKSLGNPGLVSAGADMYYSILKKLISENSWIKLFLSNIMEILTGKSVKAIENFTNYWCLTTFKKFPTLAHILIGELKIVNDTDLSLFKLHSWISLTKQANKLALIDRTWSDENGEMVISCLEHSNTSVRMLAFEIVCVSHKKGLPPDIEFQEVLKFLHNNVNSDCTVLRLSTLNNLANFFITLHTSFINYYKNGEELHGLLNFCKKLQMFIIESLNLNGNYQRKITTVKIAHLMLKHFNEVPRKKQKQTRDASKCLIGYLKENDHWLLNSTDYIMKLISLLKDPASDIHDCTLQLLLDFYLPDISDTNTMNHLIEESFKCMKSKFFFEISCGLNIFKLIINVLIQKKSVVAEFRNIEDVFKFAYNEINTEYNAKTNVVESIASGKQMHSFLSLMYIIFDVIIKNSYKMKIPSDTMIIMLNIIKSISNEFAWEGDTNTSSDFLKMNDKILSLIKKSNFGKNTNDEIKISGFYQIVLNCLWLNVKASCELAAILIQYNKDDAQLCEESLNIIAHVLETSRHKGAIEAAGTALGQGIRYLTASEVEFNVSELPLSLLKRKLDELLLETTKMSSVTRRGAGLSIMIHRIVSNDVKKGKPLFHYFMKTILITCNNAQETCIEESNAEKDLPKAIYIHFLTRIVMDSSLASDMMYYSAELVELAFNNLTNPQWQIRNAALQLYGALIPKLIGQKKPTGTDEILSSVACDEFRTHSIKLWNFIIQQLKTDTHKDVINAHSNLVPILNTLANFAQRYNFSYDLDDQIDSDMNLLPNILTLLGSPIYTVRRLTAKAILNIYSFEIILNNIKKVTIASENYLHGILMVIGNCYDLYSNEELHKNQLDSVRNEYCKILSKRTPSCLCQWSLEKLFSENIPEITIDVIKNILTEGTTKCYEPGAFLWMNQKIEKCLQNMPWSILPEVMSLLMNTQDFEIYIKIILHRLKNCDIVPEKVLVHASDVLLSSNTKNKTSVIWKTLYYISLKIHSNIQIPSCYLQDHLSYNVSYNTRYLVPYATRTFAAQGNNANLLLCSENIFLMCNPENNDIDMRYTAAIANNELANTFASCSDDIKINAVKSAVILLQDEDEDIRDLSVMFYKILTHQNVAKHSFVCLNKILKKKFLCAQFNDSITSIQSICKDLLDFIDCFSNSKSDKLNPFANDSKNIYLEINTVKQLLMSLTDENE
ncbi:uncharacterized protein LOC112044026 isoform X1 [Bicyclus anynana]|uniref:Uncharacterized protein LOC112044026 isoform X1 n=1 Tax=Bicyclus anynana TaxID=110368 RepID=A0ABM3LSR9_BICAN|nr:uncharacterized protein LOC112044026 isoform X1 [Bicyclus anynana]XP_052742127.1 uncharacterized protein LOC112044026 isoform X1 [Bicyclus anynana]